MLPTLLVPGRLRLDQPVASTMTPLAYIQGWLRQRMPEFGGHGATMADRVLIVRAETGSGKSTVLPVGILRILRSETTPARVHIRGPGVICTQPRVLTAVSLARDVSAGTHNKRYPDMVLGETVGYQTGPVSEVSAELLYATAGVLAAQLRSMEDSELLERYRFIIVDEVHERSIDTDLMLMLLRDFYLRNVGNPKLPFLILTSATIEPMRYATYFGVGAANVVEVVGRGYPIENHWPALGTNNYPQAAAEIALKIHNEHLDDPPHRADILIFMPGAPEAMAVAETLKKEAETLKKEAEILNEKSSTGFLILMLNREIVNSQSGDYILAFAPPGSLPKVNGRAPIRRIIISTSVAETGITIDTLKYVIDSGWSRTRELYPPWGATGIITRPAPRSRIAQRRGRVGRLFAGEFYPLYTESVYNSLDPMQLPDVVTGAAADAFLAIVAAQLRQKRVTKSVVEFRVEDIGLLDPPPAEALLCAIRTSIILGFLRTPSQICKPIQIGLQICENIDDKKLTSSSDQMYTLTKMGEIAATFKRTSMEGVRILCGSYIWGASMSDLMTVVAMLGTPMTDLFIKLGSVAASGSGGKSASGFDSKSASGFDSKSASGFDSKSASGFDSKSASGFDSTSSPDLPFSVPKLPYNATALIASLPSYLRQHVGVEDVTDYYRARLLLADDFAEAVLIFDAFIARLNTDDLSKVAEWCIKCNLSFNQLIELSKRRELVADEIAAAGMDPFYESGARLSTVSVEDFTATLRRLKRCIFDGLRQNLLRFDEKNVIGPGYVTAMGGLAASENLRVRCPPLFTDAMADRLTDMRVAGSPLRPQWIVTDQLRLIPALKKPEEMSAPLLYTVDANLVCVLDGYVDPDPDIGLPREFKTAR